MFSSAFVKKKKSTSTDESVLEKRKIQKLDYESTRERGIVPGWNKEFPWLGTDGEHNDAVIYCTVRIYVHTGLELSFCKTIYQCLEHLKSNR